MIWNECYPIMNVTEYVELSRTKQDCDLSNSIEIGAVF